MKTSKNSVALAAAFAGLLAGTSARATAAPSGLTAELGQFIDTNAKKAEKHACSGKNSCKGLGGCASGDNGCAGKNSCKGKGGCATDGKMDTKKK